MAHRRRPSRLLVSIVTALATITAYAGLSVPPREARAADADTTAFIGFLDEFQGFVGRLASVGELAEPLPTLAIAPGAPEGLGFADLLTQARASVLGGPTFGGAVTVQDLVDQIDGANGAITAGRNVSFTASLAESGTVKSITIGLDASRTIGSASLDLSDDSPQFSLASEGGVQVQLALTGSFVLNHDTATGATWLTRTASVTPQLSASATASIPTPSGVDAGIGILGIELGGATTFALAASLGTTWNDPNNDGKLFFDEPGGGAGDGELAAGGSAPGLVSAALTSGTLNASLQLVGRPSTTIDLADVDLTVAVSSADLRTEPPQVTVTSGTLDTIRAFLTLSPRDLAQGLAQAASAVLALQDATGVELPFMRGDLADAVAAVAAISTFLENHVPEPTPGTSTPGLPDFASLQDLLEDLEAETGLPGAAVMDVLNAAYDAQDKKVAFTLRVSRDAPASAEPLNPVGEPTTGTATYTATSFTDAALASLDAAERLALVGRQVVAGSSAGVVLEVVGSTVTLDATPLDPDGDGPEPPPSNRWQGGTPANGTAYSIAASDPKIGLVELADTLKASGAIGNANAKVSVATVKPSYTLDIPMVLDLRDPDTTDCDPDPGATAACPYQDTDPVSGITRIITSLPLAADRIMLRTGTSGTTKLLTADAAIDTSVDLDAVVGFVGVKLTGTLAACTTNASPDCTGGTASGDHLLELSLKSLVGNGADADGDIPITTFFTKLAEASAGGTLSSLFEFDVDGQAYASLTLSVPGAPDFFGGATPSVTVQLPDITDPGSLSVTGPELSKLKVLDVDPSNPMALFGALLANLQAVQDALEAIPGGSAALDTEIPLLGRSLSDLIGSEVTGGGEGVAFTVGTASSTLTDPGKTFTDAFVGRRVAVGSQTVFVADASGSTLTLVPPLAQDPPDGTPYVVESALQGLVNILNDDPTATLQEMLDLLAAKLGLGSTATFAVKSGTPSVLELVLDWKREYSQQLPLNLDFDLGTLGASSLAGVSGRGLVEVEATGEVKLTLQIPLTLAAVQDPLNNLTVDPTQSFIKAGLGIEGDGLRFAVNLGPVEASLGDPDENNSAGTEFKAGLGLTLDNAATSPQTLSDFLSGLDVDVDDGGVECTGAPSGSDDLAVCAVFPVYINGTSIDTDADPSNDAFVLRLPLGNDVADMFNPAGPDLDGGHKRLFVPADELVAAIQAAALDLLSFGDGFFGYLEFLEKAMRSASFDGKLPLIGKDLQAGAEFVGDLRTELQNAFDAANVPTDTTAEAIRQFMKDHVEPALPAFGNISLDVRCSDPVTSPAAAAAKQGTGSGTSYRYQVAAYTNVGGVKTELIPGAESVAVDHKAAGDFDDTDHINVSWPSVTGATGYVVYRSVDGGAFEKLHDAGNTTTYEDKGQHTPSGTSTSTIASVCADSTPATEITGFTVAVDIGQGDPSATDGCQDSVDPNLPVDDRPCLQAGLPLDLGIPGLSLKATGDTAEVTGLLGWRLHLKLGFDRSLGFFVHTQDSGLPEFRVGAALDVPDLEARLAFLKVESTNKSTTPEFAGMFSIDLRSGPTAPQCTTSCTADDTQTLTLADLIAGPIENFVDVGLTAKVDIDWRLDASIDPAIPGIAADFRFLWNWENNETPEDPTGISLLEFNNVTINPGEFLQGTVGPIVKQVVDVFKPVQPIIDTIFAPIPAISDLSKAAGGGDVTIATLAQAFSTLAGGPDLQPFLDVLLNVRNLVKALSGSCQPPSDPDEFCINIGSFDLNPDKAVTTDANPATADSIMENENANPNVLQELDDSTSGDLQATGADAEHPGFTFPALENPASLFGLIMGQDVELARFDSGPLTLGFEFQQSFGPVYAPPPVNVVIGGGASVTLRVAAGFDTYGIRTAVESGKVDYKILDSLYFITTDTSGTPIPVVEFEGFLQAGASVSAVIIEVGIVGGIKLTVGFFWNDPNNDGKFRFSEFLAAALRNPICLFNVGGELSLFIKVFITLGFDPFSVSFDFELVNIKLLDFSLKPDCEPPPPRLGGTSGGVLYLFAGKLGNSGERGDSFWNNGLSAEEVWIVRQLPAKPDPDGAGPKTAQNAKLVVQALGITEEFDDTGNAIHTVVFDGRGYNGPLQVMFTGGERSQPFTKKAVVATGNGKDVVRTGVGASYVDTGAETDQVTTLDREDLSQPVTAPAAVVAGGPGDDAITVGNAVNTVLGDGALGFTNHAGAVDVTTADDPDTNANEATTVPINGAIDPATVTVPNAAAEAPGSDGADQIAAGLGGSTIWGNAGDDKIGTANDSPQADLSGIKGTPSESLYRARKNVIVGGKGSDRIKSGSADDEIYTGAKVVIDGNDPGSGDDAANENSVDTGTGSDKVYGSNAKDFVTTHSTETQGATVFGGDSDDVIIGGNGTDGLYGGPADDYLVAQEATVSPDFPVTDVLGAARKVTFLSEDPVTAAKTLVGGGGSDRIYGASGPSTIYGDHEVDACVRQSDPVSKQPPENPTESGDPSTWDAADLILGGEGIDTVQAGGGDDHVHLFGESDVACGNKGADKVYAGTHADLVYGGSDGDEIFGHDGGDELYANDGDDSVWGDSGTDRIQGNDGVDTLFGGSHSDLVIGGTSKAGLTDEGDRLYGEDGADNLVGDNADADVIPAYPADLADTSNPVTLGGADRIWAGAQNDTAYGGLDADEVYGGDGADQLEGNNGSDDVFGEGGADNLIGGSSQQAAPGTGRPDVDDDLSGGDGDDVIGGDNLQVLNVGAGSGSPLTKGRSLTSERSIVLLDLGHAGVGAVFGGDRILGGDATDVILGQRGDDTIEAGEGDDYAEGGQDVDTILGEGGQDDLVGGSYTAHAGTGQATVGQLDAGDTIRGGIGGDVGIGDNGAVLRDPAAPVSPLTEGRGITVRSIQVYDLGDTPAAGTSGADFVRGDAGPDVLLGQGSTDRLLGDGASDYAEGGQDSDWLEGGLSSDDLVGGSSAVNGADTGLTTKGQPDAGDVIFGQEGDDLGIGDNAFVTRVEPFHELTYRLGATGQITERRALRLLDLAAAPNGELSTPDAIRFGADRLSGQEDVDVLLGQDGDDQISGGSADDYAEGQGGADEIWGDDDLATPLPAVAWPGLPTVGFANDSGADGQDDLIGGSSRPAFRDGADEIHGNGESDFELGDNGTSVRDIVESDGALSDRIYTLRYPATPPAGAAKIRVADSDYPATRFCTTDQATCEPAGASGGDLLFGDDGDDFVYGQDGDDIAYGGDGDDDLYGELGGDRLFGENGEDAILGDRGGVRDVYEDGSASETISITQPPAITYTSRRAGSVSRVVDLLHGVDGDEFVGSGAGDKMPHDGVASGGDDRIRGGHGHDSIHAGFGDDLANGDSGGDTVFGDDGADVLWGGKGCDAAVDTQAASPDCYVAVGLVATFDPAARGTGDRFVDYVFGGKGATSGPAVAGASGADVLDWRPRDGGCTPEAWPVSFGDTTQDPCAWHEMTDVSDGDPANNQHHQGIDWQYGGWDRDVLQMDVADNGPNDGDKGIDWSGAYNLYTHCNAAYGGFNDVREMSPAHLTFIQKWAYGVGAGQTASDVTTAGTSAFEEVALVYKKDIREHGTGKAFPSTPGHFDSPNACAP